VKRKTKQTLCLPHIQIASQPFHSCFPPDGFLLPASPHFIPVFQRTKQQYNWKNRKEIAIKQDQTREKNHEQRERRTTTATREKSYEDDGDDKQERKSEKGEERGGDDEEEKERVPREHKNDNIEYTSLHQACNEGLTETAPIFLLNQGTSIEAKDKYEDTSLLWACNNGCPEIVRLLIDRGASIEAKNKNGDTALDRACNNGYSETAQLLIDRGANIEAKSDNGITPLHHACYTGSIDVVSAIMAVKKRRKLIAMEDAEALESEKKFVIQLVNRQT